MSRTECKTAVTVGGKVRQVSNLTANIMTEPPHSCFLIDKLQRY